MINGYSIPSFLAISSAIPWPPNLAHTEHVPSLLTIQGPYGEAGVHVLIKCGQSVGLAMPNVTSAQRHPGGKSYLHSALVKGLIPY